MMMEGKPPYVSQPPLSPPSPYQPPLSPYLYLPKVLWLVGAQDMLKRFYYYCLDIAPTVESLQVAKFLRG